MKTDTLVLSRALFSLCIAAVIDGPDSRRIGSLYVAYIKCDQEPELSVSVPTWTCFQQQSCFCQLHHLCLHKSMAFEKRSNTHERNDACCTCISVQTCMLTPLLIQLVISPPPKMDWCGDKPDKFWLLEFSFFLISLLCYFRCKSCTNMIKELECWSWSKKICVEL